jgi:hypothetical protein
MQVMKEVSRMMSLQFRPQVKSKMRKIELALELNLRTRLKE